MKQLLLTKKIKNIILLLPIFLSSCGKFEMPENISDYVHNFSYDTCFDTIKNGHFVENYTEVDEKDNVYRSHVIECNFSKNESGEFNIHATYNYQGQIEDGENSVIIDIYKSSETSYILEKDYLDENKKDIREVLTLETANNYYKKIFYSSWEAYPRGGLYYGDYFITQIRNFVNIITIDDDGKNIGFSYYDDPRVDGYIMSQEIKVNEIGMLTHSMSKIKNCSTNCTGTVIQNVSYNDSI